MGEKHGSSIRSSTPPLFVSTVLTFFITLGLNSLVQYWITPQLQVRRGGMVTTIDGSYLPLDIVNYASSGLGRVQIYVPSDLTPADIVVSRPVIINRVDGSVPANGRVLFELSSLQPRSLTRIFIPATSEDCCAVAHVGGLRVDVLQDDNVPLEWQTPLLNAALVALIVTLGQYVLVRLSEHQISLIGMEIDHVNLRLATAERELKTAKREQDKLRRLTARLKNLLVLRITEYSKELTFWRDTLRKACGSSAESEHQAQRLIEAITDTLKTYGTRDKVSRDYVYLSRIRDILEEEESGLETFQDQDDRLEPPKAQA